MTDQRHSVFLDDRPDSRAPTRSPDQPITSGEIVGAHWTLGRQDFVGAPQQAETDAYGPVVQALDQRNAPDWLGMKKSYFGAYRSSQPLNIPSIWEDVARYRERDPSFLKDVPAKNADEFRRWVQQRERQARREAQDVVSRERGVGQTALGFGTDLVTGLVDPVNLSTMLIPGGAAVRGAGAIKSIATIAARDALINTAVEVAQTPLVAQQRQEFYGETMGLTEMGERVGIAALAGGVFGGGLHALGLGARAARESELGRRVSERIGKAFNVGALEDVADADIATAFREAVPDDVRSPDDRAALAILDQQVDVQRSSPFTDTAGGMDAHAATLGDTVDALLAAAGRDAIAAPAPTPTPGAAPRAVPAAPVGLSADRVIGFVMNTLEGGSRVVDNGEGAGTTKFGITQRWNPDVDVASLSEAQAAAIARQRYWLPEYDRVDPRIAAIAFDVGYINNFKNARRIIRESGGDPARAIAMYRELLNGIADTSPTHAKFKKGWNNRVDRLAEFVGAADGEGRVVLRPDLFDDVSELHAAQRALDEADMDAKLAAYERDRASRSEAVDLVEADAPALHGAWEGSASIDGEARVAADLPPLPDEVPRTQASAPLPDPEPLRATVAADAVDEVMIGGVFVAQEGRPGFQIEDPHGDGHYLSSVFRDENGAPRASLRFPVTPEAREITPGVSVFVAPELRRQGIATRLYDNLREAGYDIDALSGADDLTPAGAAFVTARRARDARVAGEALADDLAAQRINPVPPVETPTARAFDDGMAEGAARQADSLMHDARVDLDDADLVAFRLGDDGSDRALSDLVAELDADEAALQTVRNCL